MKIGILTQPLHNNYGGLLQAYALQHFLKKQGHDVLTVDFEKTNKPKFWGIKGIAKNSIKKYLLRYDIESIFPLKEKEKRKISQHTNRFIAENIRTTQLLTDINEFSYLEPYNFDAFIVGSDQVWRPSYSPGMPAFFLNFLKDNDKIKRIAYAASFGVDHCNEFTSNELINYSSLAKQFDAIGVREDSAVQLCDAYLCVKSEQVLDPTLLLDIEDYCHLIENENTTPMSGDMMVYILDPSTMKSQIVNSISNKLQLTPYNFMEHKIENTYSPVSQWLKGFRDSKFVITDSFHGVVFSIIFNKPFIVIGNESRGLTRFTSLLKIFDLENRLIASLDKINVINIPIDYIKVNKIKKEKKLESINFITRSLGNV